MEASWNRSNSTRCRPQRRASSSASGATRARSSPA
jgi:hypothetical protein